MISTPRAQVFGCKAALVAKPLQRACPSAPAQAMSTGMQQYDVVVIGAGHNGLTCAAYLGMAGLKVKVVERREIVGGAAVTEEFYPGFRNSIAAYTVSLLNPKVIADLRLHDHGLRIVERRAQNFLPALGRPLDPLGRRPDRARDRQAQPARRRALCRLRPRDRHGGRYPARTHPAGAAEPGVGRRRPRRADQGRQTRPQAPAFAATPTCARSMACSRARPASISTTGSRTTW